MIKNFFWRDILKTLIPIDRFLNNNGIHKAFKLLKNFYFGTKLLVFKKNKKHGFWSVPLSWNVVEGKLISPTGQILADYFRNPLELIANSSCFEGKVSKKEILNHLHFDKRMPNKTLFHYRNQYRENVNEWGFSVPYSKIKKLPKGKYSVSIKTKLHKRDMVCAYLKKKGKSKDTLLFSSHFDHPFQANDGIVGSIAAFETIKKLQKTKTNLSYAALAAPEIIGSIFFAKEYAKKENIKNAIMTSFSGVDSVLIYSKSVKGNTFTDKAFGHILKYRKKSKVVDFRAIIGADEIAFDNVIIKVPCGSFYRWPYKNYHSTKDNINSVNSKSFLESCEVLDELIYVLENNCVFFSKFKTLPKLSHPKLNLYIAPRVWKNTTGDTGDNEYKSLLKFVKNNYTRQACIKAAANINTLQSLIPALADGKTTCFDLAERCDMPFIFVNEYLRMWEKKGLLKKQWINPFKI